MRIMLQEQKEYDFRYRLVVQIGHLNYAGHVGHDAIVQMIWEARVNLLRGLGFTELNLGEAHTGIIMRDLIVQFRQQASLFDELLIETQFAEIGRSSFRLLHRISRSGSVIALAATSFSCFDYELNRTTRIPEAFIKTLETYGVHKTE